MKEQECNEKEDPDGNSEPNMFGEEYGRGKDQTKEEELEDPVKQDMPQKAGWLRRKWRRLRNTDNPPKEMPRADNIVFSPPVGSHEIARARSQNLAQGYPTPGGQKLAQGYHTPGGQGSLQMRGSVGMGMGRGEHSTTLGAAPITHGI